MALTDEEKKTARAYNIGYFLSSHEPALLNKIIKSNSKNEFVKAMQIGRDHHELEVNIPRKDYTPEFKNGFYNGRTLAANNPGLIQRLINSKGLRKDYIEGLKSAQKESVIKAIHQKINIEPKATLMNLRGDAIFQKGFNVGYRLAESYSPALQQAETMSDKYSKFIAGTKAGKEQYNSDLIELKEKTPEGKMFKHDKAQTKYETGVIEDNLYFINEIANQKSWLIKHEKGFEDVPMPKWLDREQVTKTAKSPEKEKDNDIDLDR